MKTQLTQQNGFPKPVGFVIILITISIIGLLQCILTTFARAQSVNLEVITIDPEPEIENWMIDANSWLENMKVFQAREEDPEVKLQEWMFNFTGSWNQMKYAEGEVQIEDWMVNTDEWLNSGLDYLAGDDDEPPLEAWMFNSQEWIDINYLVRKIDKGPEK